MSEELPAVLTRAIAERTNGPIPAADVVATFAGNAMANGAMHQTWKVLPQAECEAVIARMMAELQPAGGKVGVDMARRVVGAYPQNLPPDVGMYTAAIAGAFGSVPACVAADTSTVILQNSKWRPSVADVLEAGDRLARTKRNALDEARKRMDLAYGAQPEIYRPDRDARKTMADMAAAAISKLKVDE